MKRFLALVVAGMVIACALGCTSDPDPKEAASTAERLVRAVAALDEETVDELLPRHGGDASLWSQAFFGRSTGCHIDSIDVGPPAEAGGSKLNFLVYVTSADLRQGNAYISVTLSPRGSEWVVKGVTSMGPGEAR